jgi:hypothetical protein
LDDKDELISVALVNTKSVLVILFHFPKCLANVGGHYAHLLNCLLKLLRGHSELLCPISEFVIFLNIDPVPVPVIAFRWVVGHSAFCSLFGRMTDSLTLDRQCSTEHYSHMTPQELEKLLDEVEASRASRRRAWENLQEMRWVLKEVCNIELPPPARKTIDLEDRVVKDGVKKALRDRKDALSELVNAVQLYGKLTDSKPLTLQGNDYAKAVERLNTAVDRGAGLVLG